MRYAVVKMCCHSCCHPDFMRMEKGWSFKISWQLLVACVVLVWSEVGPRCHIPQFGVCVSVCAISLQWPLVYQQQGMHLSYFWLLPYVERLRVHFACVCLCSSNAEPWKHFNLYPNIFCVHPPLKSVFCFHLFKNCKIWWWKMMKLQLLCHLTNFLPW